MKFYTLVVALIVLITASFAQAQTQTQTNLSIQLSPKQKQFQVVLASNPTTGYQWKLLSYDNNLVQLISSQYKRPMTNRIGAGGQMVFTFKVNNKAHGKTVLFFKYARPWEANGATKKQVTVLFAP